MKRTLLSAVFALLWCLNATSAIAQSQFEGPFIQADVGYRYVMPTISSTNIVGTSRLGAVNSPISTDITSKGAFSGAVSAGYYAEIKEDFLLGIGMDYSPTAGPEGDLVLATKISNRPVSFSGISQLQNGYNIYLSPATVIGDDALVYGKIGYTNANIKVSALGSTVNNSFNGYMFGMGYKQIITGGLYGYCEVNYAIYEAIKTIRSPLISGASVTAQITSSSSTMNAMVGLGYKF